MDNTKIWKMTLLASFEEDEGKKDLEIASFYKRDYIGLGLLSNWIQITIAYVILIAIVAVSKLDFLMNNFAQLNFPVLLSALICGYVLLVGLYSVLVFTIRRLRYLKAKHRVNNYYTKLNELYEEINNSKNQND